MIAFLTQKTLDEAMVDIRQHWNVTVFEKARGRGMINADMPFIIVRDHDCLNGLDLSVFYCIGDVPIKMQTAAWSRAGRAKP